MKKNRSKLIALLGILGLLVLLTTILISTYNERIPAQERERRNLTITPQILKQLQTRAVQLFNEKRYQDAERTLKQLLNLDRDNLLAQRLLGNVYYMSGRYFEAGNVFRVVLAKFPTDPVSHANLGETLIKMQWYEAGIRELQTARILDPNQPNIDFSLSRAYKELGDHAAAERYFQLGSERLAQQQHRMQANESAAAKTITSSSTESGEAKHEQN